MRADRLLSIMMLLQTHRRLTAKRLAAELEVSERTIYRDVFALSTAGVPIYTESGPGGGISLVENYRTDLTGLNLEEVQALSMLNIPEPLIKLGEGKALKAALLKLSAAIPYAVHEQTTRAQDRIHLDASWWFQGEEATPHLQTIKQAVWQNRLLHITYQGDFYFVGDQTVAPLGLVAKASIWHLIYFLAERIRVLRISRILSAEILPDLFETPTGFHLASFWEGWCQDYEEKQPTFRVRARVTPTLAERLPYLLQENHPDLLQTPPAITEDGWQTITLTFESFETARARLLGFGGAIEVLEPLALRTSMADYAQQILRHYSSDAI